MVVCLKCAGGEVIGWGVQRNDVKRFRCKGCGKTFNARYGTMFHRMRFSERDVMEIVKFYFTGTPASNIVWAKETTESSVRSVLRGSVESRNYY